MQESATYQAIVREGEARGEARGLVQGARLLLLRLGEARFGPPDARTRGTLEALTDLDQLEALARRLDQAANWDELVNP